MFALEMLKRKLQGKLERSEEFEADHRRDGHDTMADAHAGRIRFLKEVIADIEQMQASHAEGKRL